MTTPLETAADQLNKIIEDAEDLFVQRFSTPASILIPDISVRISYTKMGKRWGLKAICADGGGGTSSGPLQNAQLQIRVAAVNHLRKLWQACEETEKNASRELLSAIQTGTQFIEDRNKRRKPKP